MRPASVHDVPQRGRLPVPRHLDVEALTVHQGVNEVRDVPLFEWEGFERSSIPDPLPQNALRRQLLLFSPETDAVVEELAELDLDNITPMRAMEVLYRMKEKSMRARDGAAD